MREHKTTASPGKVDAPEPEAAVVAATPVPLDNPPAVPAAAEPAKAPLPPGAMKLDFTDPPHEKALLALTTYAVQQTQAHVPATRGPVADVVTEARRAGIPWAKIISLMVQYGPAFATVLAEILAALRTPAPPAAPEATPPAV